MKERPITERAQMILKTLIEYYIREGQPIASKAISSDQSVKLSPASVRHVLAELEDNGYIYSPHTSAGRIPTNQGYRFFIDSLLTVKKLDNLMITTLRDQLTGNQNTEDLLTSTSSLLSGITHHLGIVTVPKLEQLTLRHIEFLALSENRILIILVLNDQDVQNRIIYTNKVYPAHELDAAQNFLNSHFAGKDLSRIRSELFSSMENDKEKMNAQMQAALDLANQAFFQEAQKNMLVSGQSSLLDIATDNDFGKIRSLLDVFSQKKDVLHLLDQCLNTEGVQIFIGEESGHEIFKDCSVVTSTYKMDDDVLGILGVVGPTRMDYQHVISIVDVTARLLSAILGRN